jgi:hypothetical protein
MLGLRLFTVKSVVPHDREEADGKINLNYDSFGLGEIVESTLENWQLPPSIEDEEAMLSSRPPDTISTEADWVLPPSIEDEEPMRSSRSLEMILNVAEDKQGEASLIIFL